jgi:hypothetical protein
MSGLTCLFNPLDCATSNVAAWFHSIPLVWLLLIALGLGVLLASVFGILLFWRQRGPRVLEEGDMDPPVRPKKPKPSKPVGDDWFSKVRRGEKLD